MSLNYGSILIELITTPFRDTALIWGIVPLYFGWLLNEISSSKASYRTAVQTGFTLIWASAQWLYHAGVSHLTISALHAVSVLVTFVVMGIGVVALISGIRRKYPRFGSFLGHTRFSGYFLIMIFPIQAGRFDWTWDRLMTILVFAIPVWIIVHFTFLPLRK